VALIADGGVGMQAEVMNSADRLFMALQRRSPQEAAHSLRVKEYSLSLGTAMGLSQADLRLLARSALLHDIGKLLLPRSILEKPGPLSPDEFRLVQEHPALGAQLAAKAHQEEEVVRSIAEHHESWDGRGYPHGLSHPDVCLLAQIISVAEMYDALVSGTPYSDRSSVLEARRAMLRASGRQLAPALVDLFDRSQLFALTW
jgi:putative nucleotidyltransferase with HDIG domain